VEGAFFERAGSYNELRDRPSFLTVPIAVLALGLKHERCCSKSRSSLRVGAVTLVFLAPRNRQYVPTSCQFDEVNGRLALWSCQFVWRQLDAGMDCPRVLTFSALILREG
jgi:hypothetical protein